MLVIDHSVCLVKEAGKEAEEEHEEAAAEDDYRRDDLVDGVGFDQVFRCFVRKDVDSDGQFHDDQEYHLDHLDNECRIQYQLCVASNILPVFFLKEWKNDGIDICSTNSNPKSGPKFHVSELQAISIVM